MNIQALKLDLIHWLTELQDLSTLERLQALKNQQSNELSEAHKSLLDDRIASYEKSPDDVLEWQAVATEIDKEI